MNLLKIILALIIFAGFFSTAHAQEIFVEAAAPEVADEEPAIDESTIAQDSIETLLDSELNEKIISVEISEKELIEVQSESVLLPASGKRKNIHTLGTGMTANPATATKIDCAINVTTGISTCPQPVDPCLINDMVGCEPPIEPEEITEEETPDVPLFSFNALWVPGKVKFSAPSTGTLENTPVAPATLTETGPDPAIVAKADGRKTLSEEPAALTPNTSNSITGLFSGANLPWLGLVILLVFGILAWRKRN